MQGNFDKAVTIIVDDLQSDKKELNAATLAEVFKFYGYDTQDIKDEFLYILRNASDFDVECITDDCEIIDGDTVYTFKQLYKDIKKY